MVDDILFHFPSNLIYVCFCSTRKQVSTFNSLQSYMVIEFDKNINRDTLHFIIDKIRMRKGDGAALLIRKEPSFR
jgi:hypothetical protein